MAFNDFFGKKFEDRTDAGKALYGAAAVTGLAPAVVAANEVGKIWKGDTERLDEINQQAAELENSPYNTATITEENKDYYKKTAADYAKAKREAEFGLTPEQIAEARQTYAETTNLGSQNAMNAGGGTIAKYINANLNANQNKFATALADKDAEIKMQKQQQVLNYLNQLGQASGISQDVFSQNFNKNILAEQAIGEAEKNWYTQRDINRKGLIDTGAALAGQAIGIGAKAAGM